MHLWPGGIAGGGDRRLRDLYASDISLLLGDSGITAGASPKSARHEQSMQVSQGVYRGARRPESHRGADAGVEHPLGHRDYDAGFNLCMHHAPAGALFAVVGAYRPTVVRMPTIVNFNFAPDMGRMTA
jgi:hypothetical protein